MSKQDQFDCFLMEEGRVESLEWAFSVMEIVFQTTGGNIAIFEIEQLIERTASSWTRKAQKITSSQ